LFEQFPVRRRTGSWPPLRAWLTMLAVALFLTGSAAAHAQSETLADNARVISQAESDLRTVDRALDSRVERDVLAGLRAKALAAQQSARASESALQDQFDLINARLNGLGPPQAGVAEAPEIQRQRKLLDQQRAAIDAAIKRGRLLEVEADQLIDEMDRAQAERLNETLSSRASSPLSPGFWSALLTAFPRDLRRVDLFLGEGGDQIRKAVRAHIPWQAVLGTLVAALLLLPIRVAARRLGQRYLIGNAPGHRIRRSGYALWQVVLGTLAPILAALVLVQGTRWSALFPQSWDELLDGFVTATGFAAFTTSLAGAVLMRSQPSWRIAPISDETASRVRPATWLLAAIAFLSILLDTFNRAAGVSRAAITASQAAEASVHLMWIGTLLLLLGRERARRAESPTEGEAPVQTTGAGLAALTLLAWTLLVVALAALATGYISLSLFMARSIIWAAMLAATLYLLLGFADDAATTLFSRDSRLGTTMIRGVGLRPSVVDQFGILTSGVLRLVLVLVAVALLMTPFGGGGSIASIFGRLGAFAQGIEIGGIAISPGAIVRAVVVLTLGLGLVRAFMSWLERRYLPATDLDGSARNSASLVARYVGIALAIIWSLASLGIGVERIALLLSALSVGIGFGLQAITQNFVSGLILLAERPIKIGDWIRVGTDEGDVRRISVRSTEIKLPDHSTLIVPNSELITKAVLNKTLSGSLGRLQVKFSVPIEANAQHVAEIVLDTFARQPAILDDPAPKAFIDSIADGRIQFNCFAHVASPRDVYSTRSKVFFELLSRFDEAGIDIGSPPTRLELAPGERLEPAEDKLQDGDSP